MEKENNIDFFVKLDMEKLKQNEIPFITFGIKVDDENMIEKFSDLSDLNLKNLIITLKIVSDALENEYLIREHDKEVVREEIDKLINTTANFISNQQ